VNFAVRDAGTVTVASGELGCDAAGTVTVAVADFAGLAELVAVTVMVCALDVAAGAVNRPLLLTCPAVAPQVTAEENAPVPVTVDVNCCEAPPATDTADGDTVTAVIVGAADLTITVAVPDLVGSATLVAVTVTVCAALVAAGAVRTPPLVIEPAVVDQVTACDGELVPVTVAAKVCEAAPARVTDAGVTLTLVTVAAGTFPGSEDKLSGPDAIGAEATAYRDSMLPP
jgi:hypothetical protein